MDVNRIHASDLTISRPCPLVLERIRAGFPSPAEDYIDHPLDLNEHLIHHPAATFFVRVTGDSMIDAGIHDGDLLIVDRAVEPHSGAVAIVAVGGELTVKRLSISGGQFSLVPANPNYPAIAVSESEGVHIWGVCKHVIHAL